MEITIYDNNARTFDRYTVIIEGKNLSSVYQMSEKPYAFNGVNKYAGTKDEFDLEELGWIKDFYELPIEVRHAILNRLM